MLAAEGLQRVCEEMGRAVRLAGGGVRTFSLLLVSLLSSSHGGGQVHHKALNKYVTHLLFDWIEACETFSLPPAQARVVQPAAFSLMNMCSEYE